MDSITERRLTNALFLSITLELTARLSTSTAGIPSGIAATARATAINIESLMLYLKRPANAVIITIPRIIQDNFLLRVSIWM